MNQMKNQITVDLLVLGGGPGGYTAAFRGADLGLKTAIVEKYNVLGGVCLNVGCVPSKALLHATSVIADANEFMKEGIFSSAPQCNTDALRAWKDKIVGNLTQGLSGLAKRRKIEVIQGKGGFISTNEVDVETQDGVLRIHFANAIIATGSHSARLAVVPDDERVWDSTDALRLPFVPKRLMVIGGGVIGLEMATVYQRLGARITVVELAESLLPGVDRNTVRPLFLSMKKTAEIYTDTQVQDVTKEDSAFLVTLSGKKCPAQIEVDAILVSVGRRPNVNGIGLENPGITLNEQSRIVVDEKQRTSVPHIFAIGDVTSGPMLAHRASAEGKIAAEVAAGLDIQRPFLCIPQVAYTTPEVATVGMSEDAAVNAGISIGTGKFSFAASARAMTLNATAGFVKLIFNTENDVLIGAELVGPHAGELVTEAALAIQNGLTVKQIAQTIHPHPSLSEAVLMSAEVFEGTVTDLFIPKKSG
ncbi:MAG: dihydrolipoyl dehydrogenase [Deltaproteobacteria bacterium]|nr:dihydrolipoyl dehydrogenase [Deltaproteobacteria bacterium]